MNDVNIIGYINSKPSMKQKDEQTLENVMRTKIQRTILYHFLRITMKEDSEVLH